MSDEERYPTELAHVDIAAAAEPHLLADGPTIELYTVANQLHRTARLHGGVDATKPPFYVLRIEPLARGTAGR